MYAQMMKVQVRLVGRADEREGYVEEEEGKGKGMGGNVWGCGMGKGRTGGEGKGLANKGEGLKRDAGGDKEKRGGPNVHCKKDRGRDGTGVLGGINEERSGRTGATRVHGIAILCGVGRGRRGTKREVCSGF